jgi:UDP-N-acetylglucosamine 1-carboxyvinyltransferase
MSVTFSNVPVTTESLVLERILAEMGAGSHLADGVWRLDTRPMRSGPVPARLSSLVHGSLYLAPALLARFGVVSFAGAGGDRIGPPELGGARPTGQVGSVMSRFGARVDDTAGLYAECRSLRACTIDLMDFSSDPKRLRGPAASSATKTALILAAAAEGETTLRSPVDSDATMALCEFLRACGAAVAQEADVWRIGPASHGGVIGHTLISDSTEIVTFIVAAARTPASLQLTGIAGEASWQAVADELEALQAMGVPMTRVGDSLHVRSPDRLEPLDIVLECNGLCTDAHPLLALALLGASGPSRIRDHVWTNRFAYADMLSAMGARWERADEAIVVRPSILRPPGDGERLLPADSRAAAVAVLAGLGVAGHTTIEDVGHLDRSYERFVGKLRALGAAVEVGGCGPGD